jgi:hypothetical protein
VDTEFASNVACKSSSVWISGRRSLGTDDELNPTFGSEPISALYGDCPIMQLSISHTASAGFFLCQKV